MACTAILVVEVAVEVEGVVAVVGAAGAAGAEVVAEEEAAVLAAPVGRPLSHPDQ